MRIGETELNAGSAPRCLRSAHDTPGLAAAGRARRRPLLAAPARRESQASKARAGTLGHTPTQASPSPSRPSRGQSRRRNRLEPPPEPRDQTPRRGHAGVGVGTGHRGPEEQVAWAGTPGRAPYRRFQTWRSATSRGGAASRGSPRSSGPAGGTDGGVVPGSSQGRPLRRVGNGEGRDPEHGGARSPHGNRRPPRGCGPAGLAALRMRAAPGPAPGRACAHGREGRERGRYLKGAGPGRGGPGKGRGSGTPRPSACAAGGT